MRSRRGVAQCAMHIPSFMNLRLIPSARGPREAESSNLNLTLSAHLVNQCFATDKNQIKVNSQSSPESPDVLRKVVK